MLQKSGSKFTPVVENVSAGRFSLSKAASVVPEREVKLVFDNEDLVRSRHRTLDDGYNAIFHSVVRSRKSYPDLSTLNGIGGRRSRESKDIRHRIHLADFEYDPISGEVHSKIVDADIDVRFQLDNYRLIIKQGKGASESDHILDRLEISIEMAIPFIPNLNSIERHSKKHKTPPKFLRDIFGHANPKLYPWVLTYSDRDKLTYYRRTGGDFIAELEFAKDKGQGHPVLCDPYSISQIEVEIKRIMHIKTGIDVLVSPHFVKASEEQVKQELARPLLRTEEQRICDQYHLIPTYDSKPKEGLRRTSETLKTREGRAEIKKRREQYLDGAIWGTLEGFKP